MIANIIDEPGSFIDESGKETYCRGDRLRFKQPYLMRKEERGSKGIRLLDRYMMHGRMLSLDLCA
jgi:hypothetical protein